jgi:hypothetical protein
MGGDAAGGVAVTAAIHHHELPHVVVFIGVSPEGVYQFTSRPQFAVCDGEPLFAIFAPSEVSHDLCDAYARRCAELLQRHGLTDVPDDIGAEVSDV